MATFLGSVAAFDAAQEEWPNYIDRVEQFFVANGVKEEAYVATLLALIGSHTYALLKSLTSPKKPSTLQYEEIVGVLTAHLAPKPLVIAERFRFYKRVQGPDETISSYMAALRRLSEHCEFGRFLDDALRDRLVCGLRSSPIQKRLLSEADLTYKKALETAFAMEIAAKDTLQMTVLPTASAATEEVN